MPQKKVLIVGAGGFIGGFIAADNVVMIETGREFIAIKSGGLDIEAPAYGVEVEVPMVTDGMLATTNGVANFQFDQPIECPNTALLVNGTERIYPTQVTLVNRLSRMSGPTNLILADIYTHDPHSGELFLDGTKEETLQNPAQARFNTSIVLNTESPQYNDAGNWVGILFAVQAIGSVLWAVVLPMFRSRKFSYSLSLLLGAAGFISAGYFTDQYMLFVSFVLIGCAWAAMLAWPFTILTNSLKSGNIGAYLGLFNYSICIPQIVGALLGGWILSMLGTADELAPQYLMMVIAGISLALGAIAVVFIKEHNSDKTTEQ